MQPRWRRTRLLTLAGSAAETVTGLVGDLNAGSMTGALSVTAGDANDNGIAITTGSGATSISSSSNSDVLTVNATALAENTTLTLWGRRLRPSPAWSAIWRPDP